MKKTALALFAAATIGAGFAGPVAAQPYGEQLHRVAYGYDQHQPGGWEIDRRIHWIQERIQRGWRDGSLDHREFRRVEAELRGISSDVDLARHSHGGRMDERSRADLQARLDRVNDQIHWMRHNDERRPW